MNSEGPACGGCGLAVTWPESGTDRQPCPNCGATTRAYARSVAAVAVARASLSLKARRAGKGRPFLESKVGSSLWRKFGRWMHLERVVDRENDSYRELVKDPETGEVVHQCDEPLSKHVGHGNARNQGPEN